MPQITKRALQCHSNMRCNFFLALCFVLALLRSSARILNTLFMYSSCCGTLGDMSVQGRSDKEIKKRSIAIFSTVFLHYIGHSDFFQNPWCHYCRKEVRRKIEMLNQKDGIFYLFSWRHSHVLSKQIYLSLMKVLKTCSNFSSLWKWYFFLFKKAISFWSLKRSPLCTVIRVSTSSILLMVYL